MLGKVKAKIAGFIPTRILKRLNLVNIKRKAKNEFVNWDIFIKAYSTKGEGTVDLYTRDNITLTIRQNIWDAWIIKEIFFDKPYIRYFQLPENPVVVDIGGYVGDFSVYAAKRLNARKVVVAEPTDENFRILIKNIGNNKLEEIVSPIKTGVGNDNELHLNVDKKDKEEIHASSYLYEGEEKRVVPCATLSEILEDNELTRVDLLKVDCEGCEYDIFSSVEDGTLEKISNIVFEFHPIEGFEIKLDRILERLRRAGYTLRVNGYLAYAYRT